MAVEHEILALCADRAALAARLLDANEEIAKAREAARLRRGGAERDAPVPLAQDSRSVSADPGELAVPADIAADLAAFLVSAEVDAAAATGAVSAPAAAACPEPAAPLYAVGAVYGRAGALHAVLWKDGEAYPAIAGTVLPGGVTVDFIGPEEVTVFSDDAVEALPWR